MKNLDRQNFVTFSDDDCTESSNRWVLTSGKIDGRDICWLFYRTEGWRFEPLKFWCCPGFLLALPIKVETFWCTQKIGQSLVSFTFQGHVESTIEKHFLHPGLTTVCLQFNILNIYHPYGCHLNGRGHYAMSPLISTENMRYNVDFGHVVMQNYLMCAVDIDSPPIT